MKHANFVMEIKMNGVGKALKKLWPMLTISSVQLSSRKISM